ncbi:MAG: putative DNA binding domain-containing protein [Bacteroidaceae bacterium]|nr:putative DNA binding domain-containing protein [Bacteroidaceae bacterium]
MILNVDESQNIEYKESWNDKYLEWICGFANAQGGRVVIGVNDAHEVVGVSDSKRLMEDIPNKIVTHLGIVADVNLHKAGELDYIDIQVASNSVPISYRGHYYYRSGSTRQELKGVALQEFMLRKLGRSWDDIGYPKADITAVDRGAIDYFLKKGINSGRIDSDALTESTHDVLDNLNLLDDDGNLKNAALLLFARKPQKYFTGVEFQIGRFGKDEGDLLEQDIIEGNIIQMADRVMEVLRFKYLHAPIHFEGMQRIETLEIPDKAFREILYNAIAHKLYSGAAIQMHVYDDRIEVWNDGGLPEGYTPETLLRQHSSKPRNKNIAYTFFKAGFIDRWGLGYRKIIDGFKEAGMKQPAIELVDGGVRVTVWRRKTANGVGSVSEVQLTDRQRQICNMLSENPSISAREMSEVLSVAQRTVERELSKMQDRGIISREGNTSAGRWLVLKMQQ